VSADGSVEAERLLAFELGGALFALPITEVAEVTEVGSVSTVPMLPLSLGGVVNHHGDALLVMNGAVLLEREPAPEPPQHLLVLARDLDDPDRFGLPVDRIQGLVDGPAIAARGDGPIALIRPSEGRLMHVLDPHRLRERAQQEIERSMSVSSQGGTS
jgi:hypothetical protein